MKMKRILASMAAIMVVVALAGLVACGQPQQSSSSSSEEKLEVKESTYGVSEEPFYVLIVGNDTRKGTADSNVAAYADGNARSDTMMLARVDAANHKLTFVTIPRDTEDVIDGTPVKINEHYNHGGITETMEAVTALTGVTPRYYMDTTFTGFQKLINTLGGITMYVPVDQSMKDIVSGEKISFSAGEQELDGAKALIFARERKKYNDLSSVGGEPYRQTNDRMIVQTIIKKVLSDPETAPQVAVSLFSLVDSNWDVNDFTAYVEDFAAHANEITYLSGSGPYEGYTNEQVNLWMATRDEDTWRKIMSVVDEGGDPNTVLKALSLYE